VVHKLVHSHIVLRGNTYYFRFRMPAHIQSIDSNLPTEIKRSLRTDSYSIAVTLWF
jgi:hypothetical protein